MLVGREQERAAIAAAVADARAGRGTALAVRGEAGIGKTALLAWARQHAGGMQVLEACATETETHLPFAALLQLLEPLLELRERLPAPQRLALEGALALAPAAAGDRFTVCVAALGLMRLACEQRPLLILVDDAQWLDAASAECIGFAARRLRESRMTMLLAIRDGEDVAAALDAISALRPSPLAAEQARTLVTAAAGDLSAPVREAVVAAGEGNPLALVEIASSLAPQERSGDAPLPAAFRTRSRLATLFERRLRALEPAAQDALLVAAACDSSDLAIIACACRNAGIDPSALEDAEAAAIVAVSGGRLRFSHPLLRSAAYHRAGAPQRRAAHRALSAIVEGDRRAWHLAESAAGADEEAAAALSDAAARASARRGYVEASLAYERAAALSIDKELQARRLLRACNARIAAGQLQRALALLDAAVALGTGVGFSPRTLHTRSLLLLGVGEVDTALSLLRTLAEAAETAADAPMAAFVTADAGMAALLAGDVRELLRLGGRAAELLGQGGDALVKAQVGACLAAGLIFRGRMAEGRAVLERVERDVLDVHDQELALRTHSMITHLRTALECYEQAHEHAAAVLDSLESISAHAARSAPLGHAADAAHRLGLWDLAERQSDEAIMIGEETANGDALPRALIVRARIAAARGDEERARACIERARRLTDGHGNRTMQSYVLTALGLLELSMGRADSAISVLEQVEEVAVERAGLLHPSILPWRPDLVEALVLTGRVADAVAVTEKLRLEAEETGSAVGAALAARCEGMIAGDGFEACFERALALEAQRPMPFERARTLLLYGSRLHRARRRMQARRCLKEADGIFERLGARPWRERTAAELRAAGARRRGGATAASAELTEQELRVATALARGLTIRQAAAALFLSPKTVDSHLQQVYAKLDIHSRARLALIAAQRGWLS
ncbi:MAG TPA: AAA family ATPase [Candidatus Limnocylindrales bacterium]|nr:AAA family ATPase [Candidatus Limnocylindrales bacterium]